MSVDTSTTPGLREHTPWPPESYPADTIHSSGAAKLSDSRVAPLVACARGYLSFIPDTVSAARDRVGSLIEGNRSPKLRQLSQCASTGDAMLIPFTSVDDVARASKLGATASVSNAQIRPATPVSNRTGGLAKYVFLIGDTVSVDIHPATPPEWIADSSVRALFTEGPIKGDAALTAMLEDAGITGERLHAQGNGGLEANRAELTRLLRTLPADKRVLIIAAGGVGNWRNASWMTLALKDRDTTICFDGDIARNEQVWNQALQLWNHLQGRGARVTVTDLSRSGASDPKIGLDDYLATVGTWRDLPMLASGSMPPEPESDTAYPGQWRTNSTTRVIEECVRVNTEDGGPDFAWIPKLPYAARVARVLTEHAPTDMETETGQVGEEWLGDVESQIAEVEFSWRSQSGNIETETATVPLAQLDTLPAEWSRSKTIQLPSAILRNPAWPPRGPDGHKFSQEFRRWRQNETEDILSWSCQGWVPGLRGKPSFILGRDVFSLGRDEETIHLNDLPAVFTQKFGLAELPARPDGTLDKSDLRARFAKVMSAFCDGESIAKSYYGRTALSIAFRPLIPVPPSFTAIFWGPPSGGKSFLASMVMAAWQKHAGSFSNKQLPGSIFDSPTFIEKSLAQTVIWPCDDLSQQASRSAMESNLEKTENAVRAVFNRASRGRGTISGGKIEASSKTIPRAVFLLTSENDAFNTSIKQRSLMLPVRRGVFNPESGALDRLDAIRDKTNDLAILAHACLYAIRDLIETSHQGSWGEFYREMKAREEDIREFFLTNLSGVGTEKRPAELAADVTMGAIAWEILGEWLGLSDDDLSDVLYARDSVLTLSRANVISNSDDTYGRKLMTAVALSLVERRGHIESPTSYGAPLSEGATNSLLNSYLGWEPDRGASGPAIGVLLPEPKGSGKVEDADRIVGIFPKVAFNVARRCYPEWVPPGTGEASAWESAWNDGVPVTTWARHKQNGNVSHYVFRNRGDGTTKKLCMVPVRVGDLVAFAQR